MWQYVAVNIMPRHRCMDLPFSELPTSCTCLVADVSQSRLHSLGVFNVFSIASWSDSRCMQQPSLCQGAEKLPGDGLALIGIWTVSSCIAPRATAPIACDSGFLWSSLHPVGTYLTSKSLKWSMRYTVYWDVYCRISDNWAQSLLHKPNSTCLKFKTETEINSRYSRI